MSRSLLLCVALALAVAVAAASDAADAPPAEPATALPDNDAVAASNEEPVVEEPAASAAPARRPPSKSAPRKKKVAKVIAYDAVEAQRDALVAQLRAQGWKGSAEDIEIRAAPETQLPTTAEQSAIIGALMLSPLGVAGIVAGGALGGAVGTATDRAAEWMRSVGLTYRERARAEAAAAEDQENTALSLAKVKGIEVVGEEDDEEAAAASAALKAFLREPCNRRCADCHCRVRGSQEAWASMNLGVVVCVRCAARHRALGPATSRIKSCVYDRWDAKMAQLLVAGGNERARAKYLARLPESYEEPTLKSSDEELDAWVRNKYQRLKWAAPEVREAASAARAAARQKKPAAEAGAPMQAFSSKEFARKAARGRSAVKAKAAAAAK